MADTSKLYAVLSGLYGAASTLKTRVQTVSGNLDTLENLVGSSNSRGTAFEQLTAISGAVSSLTDGAYAGVKGTTANGLTVSEIDTDNKQTISLALATGTEAGTIKAVTNGDITITNGIVTVEKAGKVKNLLSVLDKNFDGSGAISVTASDIEAIASGTIAAKNTGLTNGGTVYTAIETAKNDINAKISGAFKADEIVIGTASGVKASGKKFESVLTSSDTAVPTSKAVHEIVSEESTLWTELDPLLTAVTSLNKSI